MTRGCTLIQSIHLCLPTRCSNWVSFSDVPDCDNCLGLCQTLTNDCLSFRTDSELNFKVFAQNYGFLSHNLFSGERIAWIGLNESTVLANNLHVFATLCIYWLGNVCEYIHQLNGIFFTPKRYSIRWKMNLKLLSKYFCSYSLFFVSVYWVIKKRLKD